MPWTARNGIDGPDGYFDWTWSTRPDADRAGGPRPVVLLCRLREGRRIADYDTAVRRDHRLGRLKSVRRSPFGASDATRHFTVIADDAFVDILARRWNDPGFALAQVLDAIAIGAADRAAVPATRRMRRETGVAAATAPTVIVGIVDEGIAIAHERFRRKDGSSRISHLWMQDGRPMTDGTAPYGRELRRDRIDTLLRDHLRPGGSGERGFYQGAGLADFSSPRHKSVAMRASHGTHVMDLAAGYDPADDRADRPIVCVQLPESVVADTSGLGLAPFLFDAVSFIFERAEEIANGGPPIPVVINFSSGTRAGPLDGTSLLETALDELVLARRHREGRGVVPTQIVMPAGNSLLARGRAEFRLAAGEARSLALRIQPDDRSCSFVEIWVRRPAGGGGRPDAALSVTVPMEARAGRIHREACIEWAGTGGGAACRVYREDVDGSRTRFLIALAPSAGFGGGAGLAPAGRWTLEIENRGDGALDVDAAIQWDDAPLGYRRIGRQSYFDDPAYRVFDPATGRVAVDESPGSLVTRRSTLNALSTGRTTVAVAGYVASTGAPAVYASRGPDRAGGPGIDAAAIVDASDIVAGVLAAGSSGGSRLRMNGTSVAAPRATRLIADAFAGGATDGRAAVHAAAHADEQKRTGRSHPPEAIGRGRLAG